MQQDSRIHQQSDKKACTPTTLQPVVIIYVYRKILALPICYFFKLRGQHWDPLPSTDKAVF